MSEKAKTIREPFFTPKRKKIAAICSAAAVVLWLILWNIFPMEFYSLFFASLVGSNLLLAVLLLLGARITIAHYVDTAFCSGLLNFLARTAYMSVGLGLFNLIPISPLDGSKVLFAFLPDSAHEKLMRYEKSGMIALLILVWLGVGDNVLSTAIYNVNASMINFVIRGIV